MEAWGANDEYQSGLIPKTTSYLCHTQVGECVPVLAWMYAVYTYLQVDVGCTHTPAM